MRFPVLALASLAVLLVACRGTAPLASGALTSITPDFDAPSVPAIHVAPLADQMPAAMVAVNPPGPAAPAPPAVTAPPVQPPITAAAPPRKAGAALPPFTSARDALVLDEASAGILYAKGAHERVAPASLTKIMTAIVAIEQGNLDRVVTVDVDASDFRDSTLMGLRRGDRFTLRDLLYGLMLPSGNDAAVAVGRAVSGSDAAFVEAMNRTAARLGLRDTHFANPHGLDQPGHYTSAYDIAMLARYGMTLPDFRTIVDAERYTARGSRTIAMESLISGLLRWVPDSSGVKSGYTEGAGRTLVLSADRNGHRLYAVVMNDQQRELDGANLIEWGFANHDWSSATVAAPAGSDVVRAAREASAAP